MEWILGRLRSSGLSAELTYHAYHALDGHIDGFTLWELGHEAGARTMAEQGNLDEVMAGLIEKIRAEGYTHLAEHAEQHLSPPTGKGAFELGLDLILDGLKRALND
jgi:hypothetical protein